MSFLDFFFFRGIFISIAAACQVLLTYILYEHYNLNYKLVLVVFASTFIIYNLFHCLSILKASRSAILLNKPINISKPDKILCVFIIACIIAIVCVFFLLSNGVIILFLALAFISLFYFIPLVSSHRNLRSIANLKAIVISFVWIASTCIAPMLDLGIGIEDGYLLLARFIYVYILVMLFDIRDIDTDTSNGLKTTAVVLGRRHSIFVCIILLCLYVILTYCSNISNVYKHIMSISGLPLLYVIPKAASVSYRYFFLFIVDGFLILQFILTIIFKYFY